VADKAEKKENKPNVFVRYWRETVGELRKVSWPTREDTLRLTKIVLIVLAFMATLLGLLDFLFSQAITLLLKV
jgi:preprotein translocase subunit SecE